MPHAIAAAAIALTVLVAFSPALSGQFLSWDDVRNFVLNQDFRGIGVRELKWAWTTTLLGHYVPLSWMSLELDYSIWGMNPWGYHLTSILLHAANATLVYIVTLRLVRGDGDGRSLSARAVAVISALLYAVHPLRVESVAWVTERRDVLSLFFVLLTTIFYTRHVERPDERRHYVLTIFAFGAALLSKGSAVTLPAAFLVMDWYPLRRVGGENGWWTPGARRVYAELAPLFVMSAVISVLSIIALEPGPQLGFAQKLAVSAWGVLFYLSKTLLPIGLAALYPMPQSIDPIALKYLAAYAGVILLGLGLWTLRKRRPAVSAGGLAFLLLVLPFLGVVQNGPQIAADRYTYLASAPLAVLVALAMARLPRRAAIATAVSAIAALSAATWRQCHYWKDSETLWSRVIQLDSASHYAHNNLGIALSDRGDAAGAMGAYRRAIQLAPDYPEPYNNLGFELMQLGDLDAAVSAFQQSIRLRPVYPDAELNLANALTMKGQVHEGVAHYERAVAMMPESAEANYSWGLALASAGDFVAAKPKLERAIQLDPEMPDARALYARVLDAIRTGEGPAVHIPVGVSVDSSHVHHH